MGLSEVLAALAARRVHVLLVEVPGWWSTRAAAQRELSARGWPEAASPAAADVLLVCGEPGEALAAAVDLVWDQLPGPRARAVVRAPEGVPGVLDRAADQLRDTAAQRADAREREDRPDEGPPEHEPDGDGDGDGDGETGTHGDMDMDMDMAPGGIPLAGGGLDRDGLEMDVLHVPLGPVLQHWPAGLVLRCTLQGDVVVAAEVDVLLPGSASPAPDSSPRTAAARRCDEAAQVLRLAGGGTAADRLSRVRDDLLGEDDLDACRRRLQQATARVSRSRVLRWSLRGLGPLGPDAPSAARGDAHDRLLVTLRAADAALVGHASPAVAPVTVTAGSLPGLVVGLELAAVRLVVAGLAPVTSTGLAVVADRTTDPAAREGDR